MVSMTADQVVLEAHSSAEAGTARATTTMTCRPVNDPAGGFNASFAFTSTGLSADAASNVYTALLQVLNDAR